MVAHGLVCITLSKGSSPDEVEFFCSMQSPRIYLKLFKDLLFQSCVFFENLLPYITILSYCKWGYCRYHLTSLFVRRVGITDRRKLKSTLGKHYGNSTFSNSPDFVSAVLENAES
jgi:hypothetical protein